MTPFLQFTIALVIIISAAKLAGYLSYRIGQPSVLGELLVGIVLGPSVLNILHWPYFTDMHLEESIKHLAELGVLLLMFMAGLDLHLSDLARSGRVAAGAGVLGVVVPLLMGAGTGLLFDFDLQSALFIGLVLAATSVSISAQTLMELKVLRSRVGVAMLGAAVFDDILVVLGLSVFIALIQTGSQGGLIAVLTIILRMVLYLGAAILLGIWLLPKLSTWIDKLPISQGLVAFAFVAALLYAWSAESLGSMAAITGAFLAGLLLGRSRVKERIESGISTIAYSVFVPIFFVNVGLSADARQLTAQTLWLLTAMAVVAVISKVIGAGLGAQLGGFTRQEALQLGVGMMSRGEVGLIVASVGILEGLIEQEAFAVIVGVVIITTLLTPPALRVLISRDRKNQSGDIEAVIGERS
ncbi:MAG TPA: cation:proton antiporter [Anaerolineales bacterium]|nr:cation:proton antiporter [Anaerolineales bacterium]